MVNYKIINMSTLDKVFAGVLGDFTPDFYITYCIFVMLGILVSLRLQALSRDKTSVTTPYKFSWSFLMLDNIKQWAGSLAFVFLSIRIGADAWGVVPTYTGAVLMGLGFDFALGKAGDWLKNAVRKTP